MINTIYLIFVYLSVNEIQVSSFLTNRPCSHLPAGNEVFAIPSCSLLFPPVSPVICRHSCADLRGRVYICPKLKTVRGTQQSAVTLRPHRTLALPRTTYRSLPHTSFQDLWLLLISHDLLLLKESKDFIMGVWPFMISIMISAACLQTIILSEAILHHHFTPYKCSRLLFYLCTLRCYLYRNYKGKLQSLIVYQMILKFIYKIEELL